MRSARASTSARGLAPLGAWAGDGFAHEALLFDDDRRLLERCVPFVHQGLAARQPVLVMVSGRTWAVLSRELGADADRLEVLGTPESRWLGGHETLLAYDRDFRRVAEGGAPWRLVAEPTWLGRAGGQEWHRFESACNRLLAPVTYYSLCLHDRRLLGDDVLKTVRQTHPLVYDQHGLRASTEYVEPESLVPALEPSWSPLPRHAERAVVASAADGRMVAAAAAARAGLEERRGEIVLAVHELVANSLALCGTATIDHWSSGSHLCVQVSDTASTGIDPLAGYCAPPSASESGRGLWLARALADDATLRSSPSGSAVRLLFRLPTPR